MSDIIALKRDLNARIGEVVEFLFPAGYRLGEEWCIGSIDGEKGASLRIRLTGRKVGCWADFAETEISGDVIDLWCRARHKALAAGISDIREWLGIEEPRFEKKAKEYKRPTKPKCTAPRTDVRKYLTSRGISDSAVALYKVAEQERTIVFPSLIPNGDLVFVKYRKLDLDEKGKKQTWPEPGCEPILFGWQAIKDDAREVTIVEGELDALSAYDFGYPALSVPFGGGGGNKQQWIENEYERMARFEVIYLALDMDKEGQEAAETIADRLGRHRCRRVMLPKKDFNECMTAHVSKEEIAACFDGAAAMDPPELVRAGKYKDAVVDLFWPSDEAKTGYRMPFARVSERLAFRPGELTEWTGSTGAGKSLILSHALVHMGHDGARACVASLEMAPAQLLRRMVKQAGNVDRPTEEYIRAIIDWLDDWLWMFGIVGKSGVDRILEVFEYARARYGCDVFVVDSLMRLGIGSEDYEGQERAVYKMVNWAVEKNVHLHLVAHSRKGDRSSGRPVPDAEDVKGTSEIASNAFNIIGVWRNRDVEDALAKARDEAERGSAEAAARVMEIEDKPSVLVNVAKQRNGDWEGKFGLWFNQGTYQYRGSHDDKHGIKYVRRGDDGK